MLVIETDKFRVTKEKRNQNYKMKVSHFHPYHELYYLNSGTCNMFVDHNIYKLHEGSLVLVPAGEIHKTNYPENGRHERYCINFTDRDLDWISEVTGNELIQENLQTTVLSIPDRRRDYVSGILERLIYESEAKDPVSHGFTRLFFQELFLYLIRCQMYQYGDVREIDMDNGVIQEVATYIYSNFDKNLYLSDVAEQFHISRSYLSKKFKATTGFGFKEYLVNVRIKKACNLLLETDKSITEIAFLCGFNDSNYFGDAFRHLKGISPNKYRKNKETM